MSHLRMIDILTDELMNKLELSIKLAMRDARVHGHGFVAIDKDGNVIYMDAEEIEEVANEITRNR